MHTITYLLSNLKQYHSDTTNLHFVVNAVYDIQEQLNKILIDWDFKATLVSNKCNWIELRQKTNMVNCVTGEQMYKNIKRFKINNNDWRIDIDKTLNTIKSFNSQHVLKVAADLSNK